MIQFCFTFCMFQFYKGLFLNNVQNVKKYRKYNPYTVWETSGNFWSYSAYCENILKDFVSKPNFNVLYKVSCNMYYLIVCFAMKWKSNIALYSHNKTQKCTYEKRNINIIPAFFNDFGGFWGAKPRRNFFQICDVQSTKKKTRRRKWK